MIFFENHTFCISRHKSGRFSVENRPLLTAIPSESPSFVCFLFFIFFFKFEILRISNFKMTTFSCHFEKISGWPLYPEFFKRTKKLRFFALFSVFELKLGGPGKNIGIFKCQI